MSSAKGYAVDTKVPVTRTKVEIEELCAKHGASAFGVFSDQASAFVTFDVRSTRVMFKLPTPADASSQELRSRWRGLLLCIKAKFEAVNRGVETFEEAFLSHVLAPDGRTFADHMGPKMKEIAKGSIEAPLMLTGPGS